MSKSFNGRIAMNKKTSLSILLAACLILGACSQNNGAAASAESTTTLSATEAGELDSTVSISEGSEVTFIRLVMLAGRMW